MTTTATVAYRTTEAAAKAGLSSAGFAKLSDDSYIAITISWAFDEPYNGNAAGAKAVTGTVAGTFPGGQVPTNRTGTVTVRASSGNHGGGGSHPSAPTGAEVLVNGKTENAGTSITTTEGETTTTTITLDSQKIEQMLENEGNRATVTIPVNNGADVVVGLLNGQTVKNMETKEAVLEIKTDSVTYTLPAAEFNIDAVLEQIGQPVDLKDIKVSVRIAEAPADAIRIVEDTANKNNYQIVVKPVEFEITCTSGDKTVNVSRFNNYVERTIAIPEGIDPSKVTTGIVLNADGTFSHVPTTIVVINGKYYAKINSLTNSTYSVIWNHREFKDSEKHWAKEAINDMASRLVISGVGNDMFEPDRDITRAEFAAIIVKALGLKPSLGTNTFSDVPADSWYRSPIMTAFEYKIINGYGQGKFGPLDKITREQAMTMLANAMKVTGLQAQVSESEFKIMFSSFEINGEPADWAKNSVAVCIKTGIVEKNDGNMKMIKGNITRGETAVTVRRLLKKSELI